MTSKPQIWVIEVEIPKSMLRFRSEKIREITQQFIDDLQRLDISKHHAFQEARPPRIKVKQYLKRG